MKYEELHFGQIPTSYKAIKNELFITGLGSIRSLIKCFTYDADSNQYINQLVLTANYFERISCLVYKGNDGIYKKLPEKRYRMEIFEAYAESPQEVSDRLKNISNADIDTENIYRIICRIADLVCPMMACISEQFFVGEYAYVVDYVIRHKGNLPKPKISEGFPINYSDFHYWEGPLIEKIRKYVEIYK